MQLMSERQIWTHFQIHGNRRIIESLLIHMFQDVPNFYQEAMSSLDTEKWQQASQE